MKAEANAVLLMAKSKAIKVISKRVCDSHTKETRVLTALPDAGRDDWTRFKRECVLLKGKGKSK